MQVVRLLGMYDNSADAVPWLDVDSKKLEVILAEY